MPAETWTRHELISHIDKVTGEFDDIDQAHTWLTNTKALMNRWLERGDGVAVYQNVELGHPHLGHCQYVSFGGPQSQLETAEPPVRLPDIGNQINWRYHLLATYIGDQL